MFFLTNMFNMLKKRKPKTILIFKGGLKNKMTQMTHQMTQIRKNKTKKNKITKNKTTKNKKMESTK